MNFSFDSDLGTLLLAVIHEEGDKVEQLLQVLLEDKNEEAAHRDPTLEGKQPERHVTPTVITISRSIKAQPRYIGCEAWTTWKQ